MPHRFLEKFKLKTLIAFALLFVGLLPLVSSIALNLPTVSSKLEQLAELERVNELEEQVALLEKAIEHRKSNLRAIAPLRGTVELLSDTTALDPQKIKQFMGDMLERWTSADSGVQAIFLANGRGEVVANWGVNSENMLIAKPPADIPDPFLLGEWLAESKNYPLDMVFVAAVDQDFFDRKDKHAHFPSLTLGIAANKRDGTYGGAVFMKISLMSFVEKVPYDFIVTGAGKVLHRYDLHGNHVDTGHQDHEHTSKMKAFQDIIKVDTGKSHIILTSPDGQKTAFVKIIEDHHREHTVWLAHAVQTSELESWFNSFMLRFVIIVSLLVGLVLFLAMMFAGKAEKMRRELVSGLTGLIKGKEPMALGWTFPAEVKELAQELEGLSQAFIESDQNLRQNQRFLKSVLNGIQDGISVHGKDYTILDANECVENWYRDKMPLVGKKCYEVYHNRQSHCESCPGRDAFNQGILQRCVMPWQVADNHEKWLEVFAYPIRDENDEIVQVVEFIRDITDKKRAEDERDSLAEQLAFSQKMEAVGTLAGGVAHDFNNILSAINGYAEMCFVKMEEGDPLRDKIKIILESGQRAASLTQQLLAFSRKQITRPQDIDVKRTLNGIRKMLVRILGEHIDINMVVAPDLWHIHADQTQFDQVLINLAVNARDAMPEGGKLTFEAKNVILDKVYVERHYEIGEGEYVLLAVSDNGQGMDKETIAKIFEPFFTTKDKGKGTGLGLATVYGIIKQNGGEIMVYSEPGQGTTFKMYMPRLKETAAPQVPSDERPETAMGTETILLVEDDEVVRTMIVEMLTSLGYSVLEAADGIEALQTCKRYHGRIDLLLTDVVMPKMNGADLARKVAKLRPEIEVIYMSGYTDDAVVRHGILHEDVHFLQKPVSQHLLSQSLRQALDGSGFRKVQAGGQENDVRKGL